MNEPQCLLPRHLIVLPGSNIEMWFRQVPAGQFRMGSRGNDHSEEPSHIVKIEQPFWVAETPVTQAQFAVWTAAERVNHKNHFEGRPSHPAENMSWVEANRFCEWLTNIYEKSESQHLETIQFPAGVVHACLPTEAEWEYACRAGTDTEYYTGDGETALAEAGWFGEEWDNGSTHSVGLKIPNSFGLYDMHGNVWEWCHDEWDAAAYRKRLDGDQDAATELRTRDWQQGLERIESDSRLRVVRGGSWRRSADWCRSAARDRIWVGGRVGYVGFRVCLVPGPPANASSDTTEKTADATRDGGRGTRPKSQGAHARSKDLPDLSSATFPRAAGNFLIKK